MSQIKHAQQINLFMEYARRNRLTSYDRILWIALFHCANRLAMSSENHDWPDDFFQVSNSEVYEWAGLEERAIRNSRNRLKQMGLIDFQKGDGKKHDPYYQMHYLTVIGYKIVPDNTGDNEQGPSIGYKNAPDGAGGSAGGRVGGRAGDTVTDGPGIGYKNAPDGAGDPLYSTPKDIYIKYKDKGETAKENININTKATAGTYTARARDDFAGLIDMDEVFDGDAGLVPLPWDAARG